MKASRHRAAEEEEAEEPPQSSKKSSKKRLRDLLFRSVRRFILSAV